MHEAIQGTRNQQASKEAASKQQVGKLAASKQASKQVSSMQASRQQVDFSALDAILLGGFAHPDPLSSVHMLNMAECIEVAAVRCEESPVER